MSAVPNPVLDALGALLAVCKAHNFRGNDGHEREVINAARHIYERARRVEYAKANPPRPQDLFPLERPK